MALPLLVPHCTCNCPSAPPLRITPTLATPPFKTLYVGEVKLKWPGRKLPSIIVTVALVGRKPPPRMLAGEALLKRRLKYLVGCAVEKLPIVTGNVCALTPV